MRKFEDGVAISGVGQSEIGRRLERSALSLTLDAAMQAITDAGLTPDDIDAVMTYPGGGVVLGPGFAGPPIADVYDALGLRLDHLIGSYEGPAQLGAVVNACLAVSSGAARHALVYRTVTEGSARAAARAAGGSTLPVGGPTPWITAFGGGPGPIGPALLARRHFHQYGTTREQLAQVALNARRQAALNPTAVFRQPLGLDEYMGARMIADPLCLFDCDVHCDGSTAFVVSSRDYAPDAPSRPVYIEAMGFAPAPRPGYAHHDRLHPGWEAAAQMWRRTDLRPADVDVAGLYDGFSVLTLLWLEALGFCGVGEGGAFLEGGTRIGPGGELPLNTNGGQLSGGRLHGFGLLHEMCLQLRGAASGRQVDGARHAAVSVGAVPYVGCMLLRAS